MVDMECELSFFFDAVHKASVVAAQQGTILAVQIQYTQTGLVEILAETGGWKWRMKLKEFAVECALIQLCQIRLTNLDPVSASDAHKLETYAQRCLMLLTSYDPCSVINQFFDVSAAAADGMSVLTVGNILGTGDRSMVVTLTMFKAKPGVNAQPSPARTDSVFGPNRFKVCWVVCNCIHWCFNQLILPIFLIPGTDIFRPGHAFDGEQTHDPSGPAGPPHYPHVH